MLWLLGVCVVGYFLSLVVAYMLLANPDVGEEWGLLLLALSLLFIAPLGFALTSEIERLLEQPEHSLPVRVVSGVLLALAIFPVLRSAAREIFANKSSADVAALAVLPYVVVVGCFFLPLAASVGLGLGALALHVKVALSLLRLAMKHRRALEAKRGLFRGV